MSGQSKMLGLDAHAPPKLTPNEKGSGANSLVSHACLMRTDLLRRQTESLEGQVQVRAQVGLTWEFPSKPGFFDGQTYTRTNSHTQSRAKRIRPSAVYSYFHRKASALMLLSAED